MKHVRTLAAIALVVLALSSLAGAAEPQGETPFRPIFDGETLDGWAAPEMSYWSVEDGAITGRSTEENPVHENQFLVWQNGEIGDFELRLQFRLLGTNSANSGVQIRSRVDETGHAIGYQADMDRGCNYVGALYDERGRGMLANRGQRVIIAPDGARSATPVTAPGEELKGLSLDEWNDYRIVAIGPRITLEINGQVTAEVFDQDRENRDAAGALALQLHAGPPLTVQFRDIQLRRLPNPNAKRVVFVAGPRTHGFAAHEHYAGCRLLADALNTWSNGIVAEVYRDGWPKDPTAFDVADALVIYSDGGQAHPATGHVEQIENLARRGAGLAFLHYALDFPAGVPDSCLLRWIGGRYEPNWSVNPWWTPAFDSLPEHPVTRGIEPFSLRDEWYFHLRFPEDDSAVTPLLVATPPDEARMGPDGPHSGNPDVRARKGMPETIAWAFTRPDGGRGFGFTGGHTHWSWGHDDQRGFLLNAVAWIAGVEVPSDGVPSQTPTLDQLRANQDFLEPADWGIDEVRRQLEEWNTEAPAEKQ